MKRLSETALRGINFGIVSYFIVVYLLHHYGVSGGLVAVFVELFSIPFLLAQVIFMVISIKFLVDNSNRKTMTIVSMVALAICTVLTLGSFF